MSQTILICSYSFMFSKISTLFTIHLIEIPVSFKMGLSCLVVLIHFGMGQALNKLDIKCKREPSHLWCHSGLDLKPGVKPWNLNEPMWMVNLISFTLTDYNNTRPKEQIYSLRWQSYQNPRLLSCFKSALQHNVFLAILKLPFSFFSTLVTSFAICDKLPCIVE